MLDRFRAAAEAAGSVVRRFPSVAEAASHVRDLAGASIAASGLPEEILESLSGMTLVPAKEQENVRCGISMATSGVAETGSLLLELPDPVERAATALPPFHIVFLRASTIVPDMHALSGILERLLSSTRHTYLSLTTGPSRTADIERVLTIGVHGPSELHILILEGD
jgi:L-lactate dehydrogenase complex protein LldG